MSPTLLVVVCAFADVPKVQATVIKDGWGAPVLSANGLAKWGVWESSLGATTKSTLASLSVPTFASDGEANQATGWIAPIATKP